jgi:outer membrane protein assembly factor BamA
MYDAVDDNLPLPADFHTTLRQTVPLFRGKVPSEGALLDQVKSALEAMLAGEGITAKVASIPAGDPGKKATSIKFRIDAPQVRTGDILLSGVSDTNRSDIEKAARGFSMAYDAANSPAAVEDVVRYAYMDRGYAAVKVHAVQSSSPAVTDIVRVPFAVTVEEGRQYKLGQIQFSPAVPFTFDDVTRNIQRERLASDSAYINHVRAALAMRFHSRGYLDARTSVTPHLDDTAGIVNYAFDAVPGPQYHLGLVRFENVSDTMRSLLMRAWQMMPGDAFDESYVSSFLFNAQKSDPVLARSLVGVGATFNVHADPATHDVNVVIRLERK